MTRNVFAGAVVATVAVVALLGGGAFEQPAAAQDQKPGAGPVLPVFEVDPNFPTMPDHMLLGGVGGATADSHGNVWVFHRPHTLEEGNATENGYIPAPPVVAFSATGRYLQGWGGPAKGGQYEWFNRGGLHSAFAECPSCTAERRLNGDGRPGSGEHGIAVDANDNVWLTGNGDGDGQILKFTKDGKFLLQIGKGGSAVDSNNTELLSRPAGITVYAKTNEVFVADGYGNRRVVVFDADTGAYKRHWGAYGNKPDDKASKARQTTGPAPAQFDTPHGIAVSNDDIVYVSDRANNRVQAFRLDGTFPEGRIPSSASQRAPAPHSAWRCRPIRSSVSSTSRTAPTSASPSSTAARSKRSATSADPGARRASSSTCTASASIRAAIS